MLHNFLLGNGSSYLNVLVDVKYIHTDLDGYIVVEVIEVIEVRLVRILQLFDP